VGGPTLDPLHYRAAFASSLIPPPLPHQRPLQFAFPRGEATGLLRFTFPIAPGWGRAYRPVVQHPRQENSEPLDLTTYRFGSSLSASWACFWITAFISTSPGLTCPGLLAPDRRDAGSRRVGSRVHDRSEDRGYIVPQASDLTVTGDARWGSRPMAEHRVMSLGLLSQRITDQEDASNHSRIAKDRQDTAPLLTRS
jgi:hypothetical protein